VSFVREESESLGTSYAGKDSNTSRKHGPCGTTVDKRFGERYLLNLHVLMIVYTRDEGLAAGFLDVVPR